MIKKAANFWGKAGHRSLERSALVEAIDQLTRALNQIVTLPATPALRRDQIKHQVALISALIHVKGYPAPETKLAAERARSLIEQAQALGEPLEDPMLLFSVLYGFWTANFVAFNGDVVRELAAQFMALAEKQQATAPLLVAHRLMGLTLLFCGDIAGSRVHLDRAIALYDPVAHRALAMRFGTDTRASVLSFRSEGLWVLGHPQAALEDADRAVDDARDTVHAGSLMYALCISGLTHVFCGSYAAAKAQSEEAVALANEKRTPTCRQFALINIGCVSALTGKASEAVEMLTSELAVWQRLTGTTLWRPFFLSCLAGAYAGLKQFDNAWRSIGEATTTVETTKERWCEAEVHRMTGEIAWKAPEPDVVKAQTYFEHALQIARQQQAKSWELRASMSLARLWRDQGKVQQARGLLAPVYGWFTEGFDTRDLKDAKALLEELS